MSNEQLHQVNYAALLGIKEMQQDAKDEYYSRFDKAQTEARLECIRNAARGVIENANAILASGDKQYSYPCSVQIESAEQAIESADMFIDCA